MFDAEVRKVLFLCSRTMISRERNDSLSEIESSKIKGGLVTIETA
jgi:hypothetical protein